MQKETAFKIKSLAAIRDQSSGVGQLISLDQQPNAIVPHPSMFKTAAETAKELQSNCDRIEALESILNQMSGISPTITNTLGEIRTSLLKASIAKSASRTESPPESTADSNDSLQAQALADLSQQQAKLASLNQFASVPKAMPMTLQPFPTVSAPMDSQLLQHLLTQQLMQLIATPQLTQ
ncbi:hypothetical protein OSTOST_25980 [Ostertagia ostertagi]